ncbi:MAG: nucleoside triphosphate pyrophosphatase [Granulosicoccus sp.]
MQVLVLASGSQYRAELLRRVQRPFSQFSPQIDESAHPGEAPPELARRLARQKACAPAIQSYVETTDNPAGNAGAIIIASDQVAAVGEQMLGKPGTAERAREQLASMRGQRVVFSTALYMLNTHSQAVFAALDQTVAQLRMLSDAEIERYIDADQPLDCAGSFKVESLGISLFDTVESQDPTALIGLPMIAVCQGLRQLGLAIP